MNHLLLLVEDHGLCLQVREQGLCCLLQKQHVVYLFFCDILWCCAGNNRDNVVEVNGLVKVILVPGLLLLCDKGLLVHSRRFVFDF